MLKNNGQIRKSRKRREGGGQVQRPTTIRHVIPWIEKVVATPQFFTRTGKREKGRFRYTKIL
jgi:hypothetical protein